MAAKIRAGNRPDRRVEPKGTYTDRWLGELLKRITYEGAGYHKLNGADYGFVPSVNPRPHKSVCDADGPILKAHAEKLFASGIRKGMISHSSTDGVPKYVWAVEGKDVYEAKIGSQSVYHGYKIGDDEEDVRAYIVDQWGKH